MTTIKNISISAVFSFVNCKVTVIIGAHVVAVAVNRTAHSVW